MEAHRAAQRRAAPLALMLPHTHTPPLWSIAIEKPRPAQMERTGTLQEGPMPGTCVGEEMYDAPCLPHWKSEPSLVSSSECSHPAATARLPPRWAAACTRVGTSLSRLSPPRPSLPQLPAPKTYSWPFRPSTRSVQPRNQSRSGKIAPNR